MDRVLNAPVNGYNYQVQLIIYTEHSWIIQEKDSKNNQLSCLEIGIWGKSDFNSKIPKSLLRDKKFN